MPFPFRRILFQFSQAPEGVACPRDGQITHLCGDNQGNWQFQMQRSVKVTSGQGTFQFALTEATLFKARTCCPGRTICQQMRNGLFPDRRHKAMRSLVFVKRLQRHWTDQSRNQGKPDAQPFPKIASARTRPNQPGACLVSQRPPPHGRGADHRIAFADLYLALTIRRAALFPALAGTFVDSRHRPTDR